MIRFKTPGSLPQTQRLLNQYLELCTFNLKPLIWNLSHTFTWNPSLETYTPYLDLSIGTCRNPLSKLHAPTPKPTGAQAYSCWTIKHLKNNETKLRTATSNQKKQAKIEINNQIQTHTNNQPPSPKNEKKRPTWTPLQATEAPVAHVKPMTTKITCEPSGRVRWIFRSNVGCFLVCFFNFFRGFFFQKGLEKPCVVFFPW